VKIFHRKYRQKKNSSQGVYGKRTLYAGHYLKIQTTEVIKKSSTLIGEILNKEFAKDTSSETTIELNLALLKIKHTLKKEAKNEC